MTNENKKITIAVLVSLVIHIAILLLLYEYMERGTFSPPKEQVIEIDLRSKDFKIADIMPPKVEERPDRAKHIGLYDSKVKDETVAASVPRAPGRPVTRGGEGAEKIKKETERIFEKNDMHIPREKIAEKSGERTQPGVSLRQMPEDFYPDYKRGSHTYINVLRHPGVAYFVRLKRVFKLAWDPSHVLRGQRFLGEVSKGSIKVVLGLTIDKKGELAELFVINGSGSGGYDDEALRAVRASAPFSAPPNDFLSPDKMLRVAWTFTVYL